MYLDDLPIINGKRVLNDDYVKKEELFPIGIGTW